MIGKNTLRKRSTNSSLFKNVLRQSPSPNGQDREEVREKIEKRAYELYEERGRQDGYDLEDWYKAEKFVKSGRT